jgi:hypothetical protein
VFLLGGGTHCRAGFVYDVEVPGLSVLLPECMYQWEAAPRFEYDFGVDRNFSRYDSGERRGEARLT